MSQHFKAHALAVAVGVALSTIPAYAAEGDKAEEEVEKIAVVGTRAAPRSVSESPVPVDIIGGEEFMNQGNTDMLNTIATAVPSFNVNAQPISDAATLIRPANLRGLPPDSTLVLVNGKRRHRAAVIAFVGGGLADGSQGPDISVIPSIALKQVEVLRDGAAAQYGSDAIAGVINFVLKDDAEGGMFEVRHGSYYKGDGDSTQVAGNIGMPFTRDGFANFSFEYKDTDDSDRSVMRTGAQDLLDAGNVNVPVPSQKWGGPEIKDDFKLFLNMGLDLGYDNEFYMFGNWAERDVDGSFFYRNPLTRQGVFANGDDILVGDLTPDDGQECIVPRTVDSGIHPDDLQALIDDPNCFSFHEMFPGGFTPRFGGNVVDTSIAAGVKGEFSNGMFYDFSASVGRSEVDFLIYNTINASMGPDTPTEFTPGGYMQLEKGANMDFSYPWEVDWLTEAVNVSFGAEFREDTFEITAGDQASFEIGPLASQFFGIGSNGFPGFKPEDAGEWSRRNYSAYIDVEAYLTDKLLVGTAVRYEHFDDFGVTTNGKLTAHYEITDEYAVRGSVSTGFRAPTVGQSNVRNVTTQFIGNSLEDQATLPPTNPIAIQKGAKPLDAEESTAFTFGVVAEVGDFYMTMDYFNIEVRDRIAQTASLALTPEDIEALLALGINDASSFKAIRFFTNDFDTTTQGIDLVANYSMPMFGGETKFSLAANWTDTEVDEFNPEVIDETRIRQLEDNLPNIRGSLTANHINGDWRFLARLNYYGSYFEPHLEEISFPIDAGSEMTIDAEIGYNFTDNLTVVLGAQNLFDEYPDRNPHAGIAGAKYPVTSPMGFMGGYYYIRGIYTF